MDVHTSLTRSSITFPDRSFPPTAAMSASSTSVISTSTSDSNATRTFKTLYIPADSSKPVEEWVISYNSASEVSCLMDRLKPHFSGQGVDTEKSSLREQIRKQIQETMAKNPTFANKPVDDAMVDMVMQMSAIDCVPLQNNKKSTGYIGLMMYVDDQGKAKGLPVNERATKVCIECGIPTQVLGDTVIARNFDDETNFRRIDFTKAEFERETEWKEQARKANQEKNAGSNDEKTQQLKKLLAKTQQLQHQQQAQALLNAPSASKVCSYAGCEQDGTLRCSRCKRSWYCSQACQKKDWKFHKANVCVAPSTDSAATTTPAASTTPAQ